MPRQLLQFGAYELDSAAGELRKHGIKIKLQEQPLQILQKLLERPGEVVTREELQKRIWTADTFVDFDHGLYSAVQRLRDALADTAETPRYVETLPRRGYRFIGVVKNGNCVEDEPKIVRAEERPLVAQDSPAPRRNLRATMFVAAGTILVALLFALAFKSERLLGRVPMPAIHSIAVLPLQNLSNDPGQEYFADGMTEELITDLSQVSALRVASHQSVLRYKKSDKSLPEIARELNVDALVEGSIQRAGDRVRITAQLIYAPQDKNIFAKSYERDFRDALALQSTVASAVVEEIRIKMTPEEKISLKPVRPPDVHALDAYWEGRYHAGQSFNATLEKKRGRKDSEEEFARAISSLNLAIHNDPNFVQAYLALAETVLAVPPHVELAPNAKAALTKALELDEANLTAHLLMAAYLARIEGNWNAAGNEYREVIELSPNSVEGHEKYAEYLDDLGRFKEGMDQHKQAQTLDPDHDYISSSPLTPLFLRLELKRKFMLTIPTDDGDFWSRGEMEYQAQQYKEALHDWQVAARGFGWNEEADAWGRAYANGGPQALIREMVNVFDEIAKDRWFPRDIIIRAHGHAADREGALAWLETAFTERDELVLKLKSDLGWDPYRSDPRFKEIVRRVGLPQ